MNLHIVFALLLALLAQAAFALSSDKEQPIEVLAQKAMIDDAKGVTTYQGNVTITQGSTKIMADTVTLEYDTDHNVKTIHAQGNPARFQRRPDHREEDIVAQGGRMEYFVQTDVIHLYENARIQQGKDTFTGAKITYDVKKDFITADGQVSVTIHPKAQSAKPADKPRTEKTQSETP